eukprot:13010322-Alexandrium_andersonii.AAC.1
MLPGSYCHRARIAGAMLAPKAAWGALIGGRAPTVAEGKAYASAYRTATRATAHPRSCPSLRKAIYERPQ